MEIGILQLSDLHIENDSYLDKIELIVKACEYDIKQISKLYIVVTGDIVKNGRKDEFDRAKIFLSTLAEDIKPKNSVLQVNFVIIPGNHDCCFDNVKATRKEIIKSCHIDRIEEEDYFNDVLAVQNNFWDFYKEMLGNIPEDKISFKVEYLPFINNKIIFHCYNSSWISEINETCGEIIIPENKFLQNDDNCITISSFHHPINWFSPNTKNNNKARFEEHLMNTSNLVLYGHEHDKGVPKSVCIKGNNVIFSEGKAFQKDKQVETGFSYLNIDLSYKKITCKVYSWNSEGYFSESEEKYELIHKEKKEFTLTTEFGKTIETLSIPLKHSKKNELFLSDICIFPDLEPIKEDDVVQYPNSKNILDSIKKDSTLKAVIEGEDQSGKTTLLFAFFKGLYEAGFYPIYVRGKLINGTNVKDIVKKSLKDQYNSVKTDLFFQQPKRVLLIDNLQKSPLNSNYKATLLNNLNKHFDFIVFTTNTSSISNMATEEITILKDFEKYRILPLGHEKRGELIEQWLRIGENEMTIREEQMLKLIQTRLDEINSLIGNKLMPAYPIFILTLLQGLDSQIFPQDYSQTSYAHCYHALITAGLMREGLKDDLTSYINILKELAFYLFNNQIDNFKIRDFDNFYKELKKTYFINYNSNQILDHLTDANLLKIEDDYYSFSYKYIFYYLIAQKISTNIEKHEKLIEELCGNIHLEKNANILIFLSHHTKAQLLIDNIIFTSEIPFENAKPITLDRDDIFSSFISEFIQIVQNDIIEERDPKQEVKKNLQKKDKIERSKKEQQDDVFEMPSEIVEINQALRTIKILGQIVKNQRGDFEKEKLKELVESAYKTCFRFIGFFTNILQRDKDLIVEAICKDLEEKTNVDKTFVEKKVLTFLQFFSYRICVDSFTNLMFSVGTKGVDELYESVADSIGSSASKIVTFAIKSYYGSINVQELSHLFKDVENNHLAQSILRIYVKKHLYTNYVERTKKDQIIKIAGFKPNTVVWKPCKN